MALPSNASIHCKIILPYKKTEGRAILLPGLLIAILFNPCIFIVAMVTNFVYQHLPYSPAISKRFAGFGKLNNTQQSKQLDKRIDRIELVPLTAKIDGRWEFVVVVVIAFAQHQKIEMQ
jgi:hypothetical protein